MPNIAPETDCIYTFLQSEKLVTILKAANVNVEPFWPSLFAKALSGVNIRDMITNVGSAAVAAPAAGGAAAGGAAAAPGKID